LEPPVSPPFPPPGARLAALALALLPACGGGARDAAPRPDVVLISIDTLRADHLGCYGYARETSPHIDRLASQGVLFEDAVSTTSWTLPAHLSMLTGLAISAHGVCDDRLWQLPEDELGVSPLRGTFLSEVLQRAGYRTAGFYSWKYLEERFGFGPGFDRYERVGHSVYSHPELGPRFEAMRKAGDTDGIRAWMEREPELFDDQRPTSGEAVDRALAWIGERRAARARGEDAPFFLFLHLFDVHDEYVPPAPWDTRFDPDYDGPIDGRHVSSPSSPVHAGMPKRDLEHLIALYDGEIGWVDSQVGRLLDELERAGASQDTLVILTADHGEEFFEHGAKTHRQNLHRESVHVPLIARWPAALPAGRRIAGPTGLVDVAPTVYGLLGLEPPAGMSGANLARVARGEEPNGARTYLTELYLFRDEDRGTPERRIGLHAGNEHVLLRIRPDGALEALRYDRAVDPPETGAPARLAPDSPAARAISERMQALRSELVAQRGRSEARDETLRPMSERELMELEGAGYAGSSEVGASGAADRGRLCIDGCVWPDR
jgi:arylsulfatase A-like enzyme